MDRKISRWHSLTPIVTASAYSIGDVVGGLLTFSQSLDGLVNTGEIQSIFVYDNAKQAKNLSLYLFDSLPTTITDNAAFDPAEADLKKIVAVIPITTHVQFTTRGLSYADNIDKSVKIASNTDRNLYGYLVADAAPTYAASSDITIQIAVAQD